MTGKVKLNKIEIFLIVLTVVAVCFTCGYFVGRGGMSKNVTVKVAEDVTTVEKKTDKTTNTATAVSPSGNKDTAGAEAVGTVNINTATVDELQALPSIGGILAERIVKYRGENGGFDRVEEILDVYGIGTSIYEKIKDYITV